MNDRQNGWLHDDYWMMIIELLNQLNEYIWLNYWMTDDWLNDCMTDLWWLTYKDRFIMTDLF